MYSKSNLTYGMITICAILLTILIGCGTSHYAIRPKCPPPPILSPVKVEDGKLSRKEVDNVISNWRAVWRYLNETQKLGCVAR